MQNQMRTSRGRVFLLTHVAALALTACGSTNQSSPPPAQTPAPPTTPTPAPTPPTTPAPPPPTTPAPAPPTTPAPAPAPPTTPTPTPTPPPVLEPAPPEIPTDPLDSTEYLRSGSIALNAHKIWEKGYNGKGILVGVIDSGLDFANPEFEGRLHPDSKNFYPDGTSGPLDQDTTGHGTSVSGIIAAARNKSGSIGIAYKSTLLLAGAESCQPDEANCKSLSSNAIWKGLELMIEKGARVVNQSFTMESLPQRGADLIYQATSKGIIIVTSAGNDGVSIEPGKVDMIDIRNSNGLVILVGALDSSGSELTDYSNTPGEKGKYFFICAPGDMYVVIPSTEQGRIRTAFGGGTSYASPLVAGSIALIMQAWPKMKSADIVDLIFKTADDLGEAGIDAVYGHGALNIVRAFAPVGVTRLAGNNIAVDLQNPTGFGGSAWGNMAGLRTQLDDVIVIDDYHRDFQLGLDKGLISRADTPWLDASLRQNIESSGLVKDDARIAYSFAQSPLGYDRATNLEDQRDLRAGYAPAAMHAVSATYQLNQKLALGLASGGNSLPQALGLSINAPSLLAADAPNLARSLRMGGGTSAAAALTLNGWRIGALANHSRTDRTRQHLGSDTQLDTVRLTALKAFGRLTASFTLESAQEQGGVMGLSSRTILGLKGATHLRATTELAYGKGAWQLSGQFSHGVSQAHLREGLARDISGLQSMGWRVGLTRTGLLGQSDQIRFGLAQPMRITRGHMLLDVPTAWDMETRKATMTQRLVSLAPQGREHDLELGYSWAFTKGTLDLNFVYRDQPGHITDAPDDKAVALRWSLAF